MDEKISVIIPTLNEFEYLPGTVRQLLGAAKHPDQLELIVIDSGSSDGTIGSVESLPVTVFEKPEFALKKFASLNYGIHEAKGNILIFLDADTLLPYHFDVYVLKTLKQRKTVGGAFEFAFDSLNFWLRLIMLVNRFRYRMDGIYFGDQAIFCSRKVAIEVGGFPENELMDAAFFCRRLRKKGKMRLVRKHAVTSSRRFTENGCIRVFWFDFTMWLRFHFFRKTTAQRETYWRFNLDP
ncbi:MAG: glycosyltransferase [Bacteroidota bacterium]